MYNSTRKGRYDDALNSMIIDDNSCRSQVYRNENITSTTRTKYYTITNDGLYQILVRNLSNNTSFSIGKLGNSTDINIPNILNYYVVSPQHYFTLYLKQGTTIWITNETNTSTLLTINRIYKNP